MRRISPTVGHVLWILIYTLIEHIDPNEPKFLRKLRGEYGGDSARYERPLARPRKQIIGGDGDEEPTYVQEDIHDTISKAEYDALVENTKVEKQESKNVVPLAELNDGREIPLRDVDKSPQDPAPAKQQLAGIGVNAKRRYAKVVGEVDEMDDGRHGAGCPHDERSSKPKLKKGKKIKLSFNDASGET